MEDKGIYEKKSEKKMLQCGLFKSATSTFWM